MTSDLDHMIPEPTEQELRDLGYVSTKKEQTPYNRNLHLMADIKTNIKAIETAIESENVCQTSLTKHLQELEGSLVILNSKL